MLPAEGRSGRAPKLPVRRPAWSKATREWWEWLWATPQATQWDEGDRTLVRLAGLVELANAGEASAALLGEIRQLEDRYGLNPKAMTQLRWTIAEPVEPPAAAAASTATKDEVAERRSRRERLTG